MSKAKLTISIDQKLADYLRSTDSVSSTIAEAVEIYRSRELEAELERGYREDRKEAERLDREWRHTSAEVDE